MTKMSSPGLRAYALTIASVLLRRIMCVPFCAEENVQRDLETPLCFINIFFFFMRQAAGAVMADMRKHYPVLVEEASLVSRELIKVNRSRDLFRGVFGGGGERSGILREERDGSIEMPFHRSDQGDVDNC